MFTGPSPFRMLIILSIVIYIKTAEIVLINPLCPLVLGDFKDGGHPQTTGSKYPAPLFSTVSYYTQSRLVCRAGVALNIFLISYIITAQIGRRMNL